MNNEKIALVTGATSGIGLEISLGLIRHGFMVVGVGRRATALNHLQERFPDHFFPLLADLSDLEQVKALANAYPFDRLDVLIHNAGGANGSRQVGPQGFELTWVVNYLSPFLLTKLLEQPLRKSTSGRVIHLASSAHYHGKLDWENLNAERGYFILKAYAQSKLAQVMHTIYVSKLWNGGQDPKIYAVHPGVVKTRIGSKNSAGWMGAIWNAITLLKGISVQEGADNSLWLATLPVENLPASGGYFHRRKTTRPSAAARNEADAKRLFEETETTVQRFVS